MRQIRLLAEFNRCLGSYHYNGYYLTGLQVRQGFYELYATLQQETETEYIWELIIDIPLESFLKLWPEAKNKFAKFYYIKPVDMLVDIPGHSLHSYIEPAEFGVDFILSDKSKSYKKFAQKLNPSIVDSYLTLPSYFPEMNSIPTAWQCDIFSGKEIEEFYQENKRAEQDWVMNAYEKLTKDN